MICINSAKKMYTSGGGISKCEFLRLPGKVDNVSSYEGTLTDEAGGAAIACSCEIDAEANASHFSSNNLAIVTFSEVAAVANEVNLAFSASTQSSMARAMYSESFTDIRWSASSIWMIGLCLSSIAHKSAVLRMPGVHQSVL